MSLTRGPTFPLAVPPATPMRKGFFLSPLVRPPRDDDGETRSGELEEFWLVLRSIIPADLRGWKTEDLSLEPEI